MAIQMTWAINSMLTAPSEDGLTDVVKSISWTRIATEQVVDGETTKTYTAGFPGVTPCPSPSEEDFIAYSDLTEAEVTGWLEQLVDVTSLDTNLTTQVENQINPPVVELPLPWGPFTPPTPEA